MVLFPMYSIAINLLNVITFWSNQLSVLQNVFIRVCHENLMFVHACFYIMLYLLFLLLPFSSFFSFFMILHCYELVSSEPKFLMNFKSVMRRHANKRLGLGFSLRQPVHYMILIIGYKWRISLCKYSIMFDECPASGAMLAACQGWASHLNRLWFWSTRYFVHVLKAICCSLWSKRLASVNFSISRNSLLNCMNIFLVRS